MTGDRGLRYARWAKRFLDFADLDEEKAFRRSYTLYDPGELAALLPPDIAWSVDTLVEEHAATYLDNDLADHVNRMCLADTRMFMPGLNLAYTDRASMAASTEVRVPFVDVEVFAAAFSLPGSAEDPRPYPEVRAQEGRRGLAPQGDHPPAQGVLRCAAPSLGDQRPPRADRRYLGQG